jgi:hypothetical protein
MRKFVLTTAAALALSTGAALAASPDPTATSVAPAIQGPAAVSAYSGYYSGYVYPNEGLPSDEQYMARPTPQAGHGVFSHIYLYPPNEGDDSGNNG